MLRSIKFKDANNQIVTVDLLNGSQLYELFGVTQLPKCDSILQLFEWTEKRLRKISSWKQNLEMLKLTLYGEGINKLSDEAFEEACKEIENDPELLAIYKQLREIGSIQ